VTAPVAQTPVGDYVRALASTAAVPGGGSAAALAAAMGCALVAMVARLSVKRAADPAAAQTLQSLVPDAERLTERLLALSQDDIDAYQAVVVIRRNRPDATAELREAYRRAAEVPLESAQAAWEGIRLLGRLRPLAWSMTASDAEAAGLLLGAGLRAALSNVAVNLPELEGDVRVRIERAYRELQAAASTQALP
jgi:methenyltetrahydrofolate cyclohydrolase